MVRSIFILLTLIVSIGAASRSMAQPYELFESPDDYQLYPRDDQDSCAVHVEGVVRALGYNTATLILSRNEVPWRTFTQPLTYSPSGASFTFSPKIHAELSNYQFQLLVDGITILHRENVVCGDVFVLDGQSNTMAPGETDYGSEWVRTFGNMTSDPELCFRDTTWSMAHTYSLSTPHAAIGIWGMVLGQRISEYLEIPVAVINGAVGSTSVLQHLRNDNQPWDLNTIYGRLFYRLNKAGLNEHVRAILWHQGEADTHPVFTSRYAERWDQLYSAWHEDYPSLENVYIFQIRPSEGMFSAQQSLREIQRQFPHQYENISVMSTVGIDDWDGLHYYPEGYEAFGELIWALVARDLYQRPLEPMSTPPDLIRASYTHPDRDRIALEFDQSVNWPLDTLGHTIRDYFFLNEEWGMVDLGYIDPTSDNVVLLELNGSRLADKISYTPEESYHDGSGVYRGPWLRNPSGIGALTFHNVPIAPAIELQADVFPSHEVQPGDSILIEVSLTNTTAIDATRHLWAQARLLDGTIRETIGRHSVPIPASETIDLSIWQLVPEELPSGVYEYRVNSGMYPDHIASADTLIIHVLPDQD